MTDLNLGVIGNCSFAALIDREAKVVWCCLPRFDGDPVFHSLLGAPHNADDTGYFAIELGGLRSNGAIIRGKYCNPKNHSARKAGFASRDGFCASLLAA